MLKGFAPPFSPEGRSGIVPPPPWRNAGVVLAIEYRADPAAVAAFLPEGFAPADDPGRCIAHFCEWQSVSAAGDELLDPCRAQYSEFFLLIAAEFRGAQTFLCPFMYVDNDINLYRGIIQGLPKQAADIHIARSLPLASPAAGALAPGTRLGATMTHRGRRIVEAVVTLEAPEATDAPIGLASSPCLGLRAFPDLAGGGALVRDVVAFTGSEKEVAEVWRGAATLAFHDSPVQELSALRPVSVGPAMRYAMGFRITDVRKVSDL
jgi:hypothetical protein